MAKVIYPPFVDPEAAQEGEKRLVRFLKGKLPDNYIVVPNAEYPSEDCGKIQYWEYDCIVVAPHGLYNIENKDWSGDLGGDDTTWYHNGETKLNPIKTVRKKTAILASLLKKHAHSFGSAWIDSMVTLSNPHQSKNGFSPSDTCYKRIFLLKDELISHLTDPTGINKTPNCIANLTSDITKFLVGAAQKHPDLPLTNIWEFKIKSTLKSEPDYSEYRAETQGLIKSQKLIKVHRLNPATMTTEEQKVRADKIRNQQYALEKIGNCPNIFRTEFRYNEESQQFLEISDYVPNGRLSDVYQERTLTLEEKLEIVFNLCRAIKKAHESNVFHRAISPENIYYINRVALLANFGQAFFTEHTQAGFTVQLTITQNNVTPYNAPELVEKDASRASDLYSFGVLIYELFIGKCPVNSFYELNNLGGGIPDDRLPTHVNAMLPAWLDTVVKKTVIWNPEERWDNIDELHDFIKEKISASNTPGAGNVPLETTPAAELEIGDNATNELTLIEKLGCGGYSSVFRAHHNLQDKDYALKIFNESVCVQSVIDEYKALQQLNHNNIVKFFYNGTTNNGRFYTLMELLQGDNLQKYTKDNNSPGHGSLYLPLQKVFQLAREILEALVSLQEREPPMFHRDVKPQNIIWDRQSRFVLIDFNVAANEKADQHLVGTNPYLPPDLIVNSYKMNWDKSADPFALGITLYELICQCYPWHGSPRMPRPGIEPVDPREKNPKLSHKFASFLLKSISCKGGVRFSSAKDMLSALLEIGEDGIWGATPSSSDANVGAVVDTDAYVNYLNTLYSQSRFGNAGTRSGIDASSWDKATYIETKLDSKLLTAICDGTFRLVIITGNAGDGKTAFIRKIEEHAQNVKRFTHANGARFEIAGIPFQSNYDGSQDEDAQINNDVLKKFFEPLENRKEFSTVPVGRIIAINEGKLADFLGKSPALHYLSSVIDQYFNSEGKIELPDGLLVINLNLRSVTAPATNGITIFKAQLQKICQPYFWKKCQSCSAKKYCFIKYNVDSINDSAAGDEVVSRLEWVLRMVSYRRELHITIRDLRSFIAFLLTGDQRCQDVTSLHDRFSGEPERYWEYFYFNIMDENGIPSQDRLVRLVRKTDVAQVAMANIDRELYFCPNEEKYFNHFADRTQNLIETFNAVKTENPSRDIDDAKLELLQRCHRIYVRHHFFEGNFDIFKSRNTFFCRFPYKSLLPFYTLLTETTTEDRRKSMTALAQAVSISEGCRSKRFAEKYLLLSSSHVADPFSKTYRRFMLSDFELLIEKPEHLITFIEYENSSIVFRNKNDHHIQLSVTLDLYEMLYYIQRGFSPSINDLQGHFIELQVFKTFLENKRYDEILVTKNDKDFHLIQLDPNSNKIQITPLGDNI